MRKGYKEWARCRVLKRFWNKLFPPNVPLILSLPEKPRFFEDDEDSIRALATHPGFVSLTYRFQAQAAILDAKLRTTKHENLREVDRLQGGQYWLNYMKAEVDKLVFNKKEARFAVKPPTEQEQFKQVLALIEGV
jgi:hypothetical protein